MARPSLVVVALLAAIAFASAADSSSSASSPPPPPAAPVWYSACGAAPDALKLVAGRHVDCAAWGFHSDTINATGWAQLSIESNAALDDGAQTFAAGWLEAAISAERIYQSKLTTFFLVFTNSVPPPQLINFITQNLVWMRDQMRANNVSSRPLEGVFDEAASDAAAQREWPQSPQPPRDAPADPVAYWSAVSALFSQLKGMWMGYRAFGAAGEPLAWFDLYLLQAGSDCEDLLPALGLQASLSAHSVVEHCSALVKLTPDFQEIFVSHVTWSGYTSMLRQWKRYRLPLSFAAAVDMQFSSYPGELWSNDDFYTLRETRMVVQETTNAILNITILSSILTPVGTLPVWVRTQLANRLAVDGASWAAAFAPFNSGTYNNEFQIVDTKMFVPGLAPAPRTGVLTIVSQIPGNLASADMTELLADQLYWPSYNRPFFPAQFDAMGYAPWAAKYPEYFTYSNYSRARIFRREHHNVTSMDAMKRLMTLNQWQTDPLSLHNAGEAIAGRFDLIDCPNPVPELDWFTFGPSGAIDAKVTTASAMRVDLESGDADAVSALAWRSVEQRQQHRRAEQLRSQWQYVHGAQSPPKPQCCESAAISGPTHADQAPFTWKGVFPDQLHVGQPETFDFDWTVQNLAAL